MVNGEFSSAFLANVRDAQRKLGVTSDGKWGSATNGAFLKVKDYQQQFQAQVAATEANELLTTFARAPKTAPEAPQAKPQRLAPSIERGLARMNEYRQRLAEEEGARRAAKAGQNPLEVVPSVTAQRYESVAYVASPGSQGALKSAWEWHCVSNTRFNNYTDLTEYIRREFSRAYGRHGDFEATLKDLAKVGITLTGTTDPNTQITKALTLAQQVAIVKLGFDEEKGYRVGVGGFSSNPVAKKD
jgi:hypothetical protein